MNKIIKSVLFLLSFTIIGTMLFACNNSQSSDETQTTIPDKITTNINLEIVKDGKTDFVLCRPEIATDSIITNGQKIIGAIKSSTGASIAFKSDWHKEGDFSHTDKLEILLGKTNRAETKQIEENLKFNDYFVGVVGSKVVILGGNEEATQNAVNYFIKNYIRGQNPKPSENGNIFVESDSNYTYAHNYRIRSLVCLDKNINNYSIITSTNPSISEFRFAVEFKDYIARHTGHILKINTDDVAASNYEILIGKTSRTTISVANNEYKIDINGTKIQILAENLFAYDLAYLKIREIIPFEKSEISLGTVDSVSEIDSLNNRNQRSGDVRILINNVLGNYDESLYPIEQRSKMLAELYYEYDADVMGFQEFSTHCRNTKKGIMPLINDYEEVPVGVSSDSNYTPLFYRADRLTLVESGYHLYNDGMNDRSKSVTWAVFDVKATGKRFAVTSTHFYWTSDANAARLLDAEQLLGIINSISTKYNCPVFSGGDYNCNPSSQPYKNIISAGCVDVQSIANKSSNYKTCHTYPEFNKEKGIYDTYYDVIGSSYSTSIDHIFLCGNKDKAEVQEFRIINDKYALLSTDHTPLIVDFNIK